jgi:hypothetical protein
VIDYGNIGDYDGEARTTYLRLMRDQIVRGFVVLKYTLIDELLGSEICRYLFGRRGFIQLWRTQRFRTFNHYILEELFLLQKLRLVKSIRKIPKEVAADVERINALRNGLAHAFFPENLRKSRPVWKGKNIFSVEGFELFAEDVQRVTGFFVEEFYLPRRLRGSAPWQHLANPCGSKGEGIALSRLKHGFESRWGHHFDLVDV